MSFRTGAQALAEVKLLGMFEQSKMFPKKWAFMQQNTQ